MPIEKYYGGHGKDVMRRMKQRYGAKGGERVFYATANKRGDSATETALKKKIHRRGR